MATTSTRMTECCLICGKEDHTLRALPECFHKFCLRCLLNDHGSEHLVMGDILSCPQCRKEFKIPDGGLYTLLLEIAKDRNLSQHCQAVQASNLEICDICEGFPAATSFCTVCRQNLCAFCTNQHTKIQSTKTHEIRYKESKTSNSAREESVSNIYCDQHSEELTLYCEECKIVICPVCNSTKHPTHSSTKLEYAAPVLLDQINEHLSKVDDSFVEINSNKKELVMDRNSIKNEMVHVKRMLQVKREEIVAMIDDEHHQLIQELKSFEEDRLQETQSREVEIEKELQNAEDYMKKSRTLIDKKSSLEICRTANDLILQGSEVKNSLTRLHERKPSSASVELIPAFMPNISGYQLRFVGVLLFTGVVTAENSRPNASQQGKEAMNVDQLYDKYESEVQLLQQKYDTEHHQFTESREALKKSESEAQQLQQKCDTDHHQLTQLREALKKSESEAQQLQQKCDTDYHQLTQLREAQKQSELEAQQLKQKCDTEHRQLTESREALKKSESEAQQLKQKYDMEHQQKYDTEHHQLTQLREALKQSELEAQQLQQKYDTEHHQLTQLKEALKKSELEAQQLKKKCDMEHHQLTESREALKKSESEAQQLQQKYDTEHNQLTQSREVLKKSESEAQQLKQKYDMEHQQKYDIEHHQLTQLREALKQSELEAQQLQQKYDTEHRQLNESREALKMSASEAQQLQQKYETEHHQLTQLREALKQSEHAKADLNKLQEVVKKQSHLEDSKMTNQSPGAVESEIEKQKQQLQNEIALLKDQHAKAVLDKGKQLQHSQAMTTSLKDEHAKAVLDLQLQLQQSKVETTTQRDEYTKIVLDLEQQLQQSTYKIMSPLDKHNKDLDQQLQLQQSQHAIILQKKEDVQKQLHLQQSKTDITLLKDDHFKVTLDLQLEPDMFKTEVPQIDLSKDDDDNQQLDTAVTDEAAVGKPQEWNDMPQLKHETHNLEERKVKVLSAVGPQGIEREQQPHTKDWTEQQGEFVIEPKSYTVELRHQHQQPQYREDAAADDRMPKHEKESRENVRYTWPMQQADTPESTGILVNSMCIIPSTADRTIQRVVGLAVLGDELFVVRDGMSKVQVYTNYYSSDFTPAREITIQHLEQISGIAACSQNNCVYLSISKPTIGRVIIRRILQLSCNPLDTSWQVNDRFCFGLAVTQNTNVLATLSRRVAEYTTDGTLLQEITLPVSIANPRHSVQLSTGNLAISYGSFSQQKVSVVDHDSKIISSYVETKGSNVSLQLSVDKYDQLFVADFFNNRVLLLSPTQPKMKDIGNIATLGATLKHPLVVHLNEPNNRLYIGEESGRVLVLELNNMDNTQLQQRPTPMPRTSQLQ